MHGPVMHTPSAARMPHASLPQAHSMLALSTATTAQFGKCFRGQWRGLKVAVKVMVLPAHMSGREKRERMIVFEAGISSEMSHPNVVQVCRGERGNGRVGPCCSAPPPFFFFCQNFGQCNAPDRAYSSILSICRHTPTALSLRESHRSIRRAPLSLALLYSWGRCDVMS